MRMSRKGFTLIELMVSISILSIMMVFLYKSYASLNKSNSFYKGELNSIKSEKLIKRIIYMDFSLAMSNSTQVLNQTTNEDVVFLQSANSVHNRYNPYIAYLVKDKKLYRLESLKPFKEYPLDSESEFSGDYLGKVKSFRVYKNSKKEGVTTSELYLVHIDFKSEDDILIKIKVLNEQ